MNPWFGNDGTKAIWINGICKEEAIDKQIDAQSSNEPVTEKQWNNSSAAADPNSKLWKHMEIVFASMLSGSYSFGLWPLGQLIHWFIAWLILIPTNRATNHCGQETIGPPPTNHRGWVVSMIHWSNRSLMIHWYIDSASLMHWCIDALTLVQWRSG